MLQISHNAEPSLRTLFAVERTVSPDAWISVINFERHTLTKVSSSDGSQIDRTISAFFL
ncbi:MAG: hypothetical protein ACJ0RO_01385 [Candidatus Neomarinimicrobiota bacterium]